MHTPRPVAETLWQKIQGLAPKPFQFGVAKEYSVSDLEAGALSTLGINVVDGKVNAPTRVVPREQAGKWSERNVNGLEVPRKDLPKVPRSVITWVHPYGKTTTPSVPAFRTVKAYPRETWYGHGLAILVHLGTPVDGQIKIGFQVDRLFSSGVRRDDRDLVLAASLLREIVGTADVMPADSDPVTWVKHQQLTWELLPQGKFSDEVFRSIISKLHLPAASDLAAVAKERNNVIWQLKPERVATGVGNFNRYVAYIFKDDLVVLENLAYGNALYVMFENWTELSQKSRLELLADPQSEYIRIVHQGHWQSELQKVIYKSRTRRNR